MSIEKDVEAVESSVGVEIGSSSNGAELSEDAPKTAVTDDGRVLEIVSCAEAKGRGLKLYFTGKPCPHGHIGERCVSSRGCLICTMQAHREREQRKRDIQKVERQKQQQLLEQELDEKYPNRISREEAQEKGFEFYFTGVPCVHGHIADRRVSSKACVVCEKKHFEKQYKKRRDVTAQKEKQRQEEFAKRKELDPRLISKEEALELGLTRFFTGIPCIHGHVSERYTSDGSCCECDSSRSKKWDKEHPKERLEAGRRSRKKHQEKRNKEKRVRRKSDLNYALRQRYSSRLHNAVRYWGGDNSVKSAELLGCSVSEFKAHLKSTMTPDMTWDDFLEGRLHMDHIKPCVLFDLTDSEQVKECFSYKNYQMLWKEENLSKGAKYNGIDYRFHKEE